MEKYYYLLNNSDEIEELKEYIWTLVVNNDKVTVEQHDLGEKGVLYEIKVGEEFKVDWNWWGKLSKEEKEAYWKKLLKENRVEAVYM